MNKKIALFSKGQPSRELGATKNRFELADALKKLGWKTTILGSTELGLSTFEIDLNLFSPALKQYLVTHADEYDVVLYDFDALPYSRDQFSLNTLFVARPALISEHLISIKIPLPLRNRIKQFLKYIIHPNKKIEKYDYSTVKEADVVQVQNTMDKALLISKGVKPEKIVIIPNGISSDRMEQLSVAYHNRCYKEVVFVFVGTFDFRKGMADLIWIIRKLSDVFPSSKFHLLGTKGMISDADGVLSYFPRYLRKRIYVLPTYMAVDLPSLLNACTIGIFPSYLESFGYGALEMMAAGIPVVSYNIPGPCDFVVKDLLIDIGNRENMLEKLIHLGNDPQYLKQKAQEVHEIAQAYLMDRIGLLVDSVYQSHIAARK